VAKLR